MSNFRFANFMVLSDNREQHGRTIMVYVNITDSYDAVIEKIEDNVRYGIPFNTTDNGFLKIDAFDFRGVRAL